MRKQPGLAMDLGCTLGKTPTPKPPRMCLADPPRDPANDPLHLRIHECLGAKASITRESGWCMGPWLAYGRGLSFWHFSWLQQEQGEAAGSSRPCHFFPLNQALGGATPVRRACRPRKTPPVFAGRTLRQLQEHRRTAFENEIYCWQDHFKWSKCR